MTPAEQAQLERVAKALEIECLSKRGTHFEDMARAAIAAMSESSKPSAEAMRRATEFGVEMQMRGLTLTQATKVLAGEFDRIAAHGLSKASAP